MTKELDRRFRHVGRIKRSWGTEHKPTIRLMEAMMTGLFERGRLDILRGIQSKEYSPLQVWDAYRSNELERLPTAATLAPLKESMEKWIAKKDCSEAHRRSLEQSLRHLLKLSHSTSSVGDVPVLLSRLREKLSGLHSRSFNLSRAAAQAFVKSTLKRSHPIYSAITDIEPLPVTAQRSKRPVTPIELRTMTKDNPGAMVAHNAWQMALTGMGPSEYWGKWHVEGIDRVRIFGTKREGRDRFVPYIRDYKILTPPQGSYVTFRKQLTALSKGELRPYDLRRSYANWMEGAGVPRTRRRLYMGHGESDITDRYEWHEVERFLEEDAHRLYVYIVGAKQRTRLRLEKKA